MHKSDFPKFNTYFWFELFASISLTEFSVAGYWCATASPSNESIARHLPQRKRQQFTHDARRSKLSDVECDVQPSDTTATHRFGTDECIIPSSDATFAQSGKFSLFSWFFARPATIYAIATFVQNILALEFGCACCTECTE